MKAIAVTDIQIATIDISGNIAMHLQGNYHSVKGIQGPGNLVPVYNQTEQAATIIMTVKVESVISELTYVLIHISPAYSLKAALLKSAIAVYTHQVWGQELNALVRNLAKFCIAVIL